ncbi:MAG: ISAs1 family transposase [Candidatus Poribacteria bacterium]|nr:ISAs1 family transposase [Candidatus Poribacteria bacterium]
MTRHHACHLLDMLAEVPDPRKPKGKRHPLTAILGLMVIGLMCDQKSYTAIAMWARQQPKIAKALGFRRKPPCPATFHNLFKRLDVVKLEQILTQWVTQTLQRIPIPFETRLTAVAIDGKSLRGAATPKTPQTHLLAAVFHDLAIPMAQCAVNEKTNEVPISTELLKAFNVSKKVITTDALLTQRAFCQDVLDRQADYLLPVKANQKTLFENIQDLFQPFSNETHPEATTPEFAVMHTEAEAYLQTHQDVETAHGYTTTRTLTASTLLNNYTDWPGLRQVYQYHSQRQHLTTGKHTYQTQYGITSLMPEQASPEDLLNCRRRHCTIENKLHWIRDVVFRQDASRVRTAGIPHVMAALRNTALAVLRFTGHTKITQELRTFAANPILAVKLIK